MVSLKYFLNKNEIKIEKAFLELSFSRKAARKVEGKRELKVRMSRDIWLRSTSTLKRWRMPEAKCGKCEEDETHFARVAQYKKRFCPFSFLKSLLLNKTLASLISNRRFAWPENCVRETENCVRTQSKLLFFANLENKDLSLRRFSFAFKLIKWK